MDRHARVSFAMARLDVKPGDSMPNKFINVGQDVEVMVLDINSQNHRISLGMKQCEQNPWQAFSEKHKVGDVVEGVVKNFTEFGLFIGFDII